MEIPFRLCLVTCISLFIIGIAKEVELLYVVHHCCSNGLFHTYLSLLFSRKTEKVCVGLEDLRPILNKTPYELLKGRKPNVSHLHVFGGKCFVLNNGKDNLGKFD